MTTKLRNRILGYVEKALEQGYYLRRLGDVGTGCLSYIDDWGGCCVLGAIEVVAGNTGHVNVRDYVADLLGIHIAYVTELESGFEGKCSWNPASDFYQLGMEIAETYR